MATSFGKHSSSKVRGKATNSSSFEITRFNLEIDRDKFKFE